MFAVDTEKAFDNLEWDFLYTVMERLQLGQVFVAFTRLLYTDPTDRVKTGGVIAERYEVGHGIRQGCPLLPLLFALAMALLASCARSVDKY